MNVLKSHLTIYFIFGFLYFLAIIMDWFLLSYIAKPLFIGAIFFYYLEECKTSIDYWNCTILTLLFFSGIINLLEGYSYFIYVLSLNFSAYCLLLFQLLKKIPKKKRLTIEKVNFLYILIMIVFLISLLYTSSFIIFERYFELYSIILVYGLALTFFVLCVTIIYLTEPSTKITYLMLYALDVIICELFYGIYHYYYKITFIRFISVFCYILSFYFLVHYFLKENSNSNENRPV